MSDPKFIPYTSQQNNESLILTENKVFESHRMS